MSAFLSGSKIHLSSLNSIDFYVKLSIKTQISKEIACILNQLSYYIMMIIYAGSSE